MSHDYACREDAAGCRGRFLLFAVRLQQPDRFQFGLRICSPHADDGYDVSREQWDVALVAFACNSTCFLPVNHCVGDIDGDSAVVGKYAAAASVAAASSCFQRCQGRACGWADSLIVDVAGCLSCCRRGMVSYVAISAVERPVGSVPHVYGRWDRAAVRIAPRRRRAAMSASIPAIVLAAGASRRLGQPKQLLKLDGETLVERAVRLANEAGAAPVIAVLGAHYQAIRAAVALEGAIHILNDEWEQGIASSIRAGIDALDAIAREASGVLILSCDQPRLTAGHLRALIQEFTVHNEPTIVASAYAGVHGVPAVFPREAFGNLLA